MTLALIGKVLAFQDPIAILRNEGLQSDGKVRWRLKSSPGKSAYRHLGFAGFPHDENPVSRDLAIDYEGVGKVGF